jgi:hypothetical protein
MRAESAPPSERDAEISKMRSLIVATGNASSKLAELCQLSRTEDESASLLSVCSHTSAAT